jgi:alkyl hydroperoxide reductase subunit AhpF
MVILAHKFAFENPNIQADMVEATEFPQLMQKYRIMGVPKTMIGESESLEGFVQENILLDKIVETN